MSSPGGDSLDFSPRDSLVLALRRWWLVALLALAGGLAGLAVNALSPTLYEARFTLTTSIDQTNTGELTQFEIDTLMDAVGFLAISNPTLERTAAAAQAAGIPVDLVALRSATRAERRLAVWIFRVRRTDSNEAARLAEIWRQTAQADLDEAYRHAILADALTRRADSLAGCLAQFASSGPAPAACWPSGFTDLQAELTRTGQALAAERAAARGVSSGVEMDSARFEVLTPQPASNRRAPAALAGLAAGLLVGLWASQAAWPVRKRRA